MQWVEHTQVKGEVARCDACPLRVRNGFVYYGVVWTISIYPEVTHDVKYMLCEKCFVEKVVNGEGDEFRT